MRLRIRGLQIAAVCLTCPAVALSQMAILLRATSKSQILQNRYADREDLSRMTDAAMIQRFDRGGYLVDVPPKSPYYDLANIPERFRYLRPWSKLFLDRLSRQYYARFGKELRVTSLVRTVKLQARLTRTNGNAADAHGRRRSSHLTGATLDISKRGMTLAERNWMRRVLHSLKKQSCLYAVEEFSQPAFHIMVYRSYTQYVARITRRKSS
jgi:hypothetical protein